MKRLTLTLIALLLLVGTAFAAPVAVDYTTTLEDLGGGRFQLDQGGSNSFYQEPSSDEWKSVDFSQAEASPPSGLTHFYKHSRIWLAINSNTGRFRVYPTKNLSEYLEIYDLGAKPFIVNTSTSRIEITRNVPAWDAVIKFTFDDRGLHKQIIFQNLANMPDQINMGLKTVGLQRQGRRIVKNGGTIMLLPNPIWWGSGEDEGGGISENINGETVTLTIPKGDMGGATFPLIVDPSVVLPSTSADTQISENTPNNNAGAVLTFRVKSSAGANGRALGAFDFSSSVLAGSTINSAILELYMESKSDLNPARPYNVNRLTPSIDWVEGAGDGSVPIAGTSCWNDKLYDAGSPTRWAGGGIFSSSDYTATDEAETNVDAALGWKSWTVTNQIQTALDSVSGVWHFVVRDKTDDSASDDLARFTSSEGAANKPKLTIDFTLPVMPMMNQLTPMNELTPMNSMTPMNELEE